jgi:ribosomal protein S1
LLILYVNATVHFPTVAPQTPYTVNQHVRGKVVGFAHDGEGAFVEIEPGVGGFLPKDEIVEDRVDDARKVLKEGQAISTRVVDADYSARLIRLSARNL